MPDQPNIPRLFLFDAYALIFRAYYAFINRPMVNTKGQNTSAIYGFTTSLFDVMKKEKPDYAGVVFDPPSPTFRNELYSEYKANRMVTPEDIRKAVPYIKKIIEASNIPVFEVIGFEADDVIGTLAKKAEKEGLKTFMVTPDKDYSQLVSENIFMYKPSRSGSDYEIVGVPEVSVWFGVENPGQVIDILALWGDSSDNIPGAPGIGEKTAKELISKYKSLDNLLNNLNELKGKQQENIRDNVQQIQLSQQLARICTTVPVDLDLEQLKTGKRNDQQLRQIFNELEFKGLITRVLGNNTSEPVQGSLFESPTEPATNSAGTYKTIHSTPHLYKVIDEEVQLKELAVKLMGKNEFCFDTETTGLDTRVAEIVGLAVTWKPHEAYYVTFPADQHRTAQLLKIMQPVFENKAIKKIGQNLKYDIQILMNYGISVEGELFDTMIAHYLIQPDLRHNMDYLAEIYLDYKTVHLEELIGKKGSVMKGMREVDLDVVKEYAGEDADITLQLSVILAKELEKYGLEGLAEKIEMPLVRVLAEMEYAGFKISVEGLNNYAELLKKEILVTESEIFSLAGDRFNINSPRQLGEVLFEKMKIADGTQKTKTKQYSTGEEVLSKLTDKHPIVNKILDYRALQKLLNTYVEALPGLIDKKTDKIHTSFEQAWVSTGRLSSKNPNLQNIPIRDERGKEIRKAFIPRDNDHVLLSADYSQIELRLIAHLSNDANMIEAFIQNEDIHKATAAKIYKVAENEVTPNMRARAKTANFGIIYGISSFGLSQRLNISRTEAAELIKGYFDSYRQVKEYMDNAVLQAKEKGYVETIMGRRRYLPDIHSANAIVRGVAERNAINAPIQGSAADIIKLAMVNIQNKLRNSLKSVMILQVHDELIFDVSLPELDRIKEIVKYEMEHAINLKVPLLVDMGTGSNWLEAH
ncbi:MAG TPA: DNA polymerase I [Bacteroidales bacterium]|nr:DNA polymerase I [Bacteroidales bacterium]